MWTNNRLGAVVLWIMMVYSYLRTGISWICLVLTCNRV